MAFFHCYRAHRFNSRAQQTVDQANAIIADMSAQGYTLTLRQLYYRFVAKDLMPNNEKQYKRLGRLVTQAREAGVMDWTAIEDAGRSAHGAYVEENPNSVVEGIEVGLCFDQWARQSEYLEVWVEKQALEGVIRRPCKRHDVRYMACKGYLSASEAWRAGLRFQNAIYDGKRPVLIHLADHDPSGLDMTDDNSNRIRLFAEDNGIEVRRIALNAKQIDQYKPPPNPAKITDSRYAKYMKDYGPSSWELDALEPSVLDDLIDDTITEYIDQTIWDEVLVEQAKARKPLAALSRHWLRVNEFLHKEGLVE